MGPLSAGLVLDADVRSAIAASNLRGLPPGDIADLAVDATRRRIPAATTVHRQGEAAPHLELVVTGFIRVYVTAPDGRTMTVRYCRPGAILGAVSLFATSFALPATIQALVPSELLALRPATVRRLVDRDARVARALLQELSERVLSFIAEIPSGAFATVRQRVARHLLDLASEQQRDRELVARVTQQELADAVGTVREVVVRTLRELRAAGLVQTRREGIFIVDPERLLAETYVDAVSPDAGE